MDNLKANLLSLTQDVTSYLFQEELLDQKYSAPLTPGEAKAKLKPLPFKSGADLQSASIALPSKEKPKSIPSTDSLKKTPEQNATKKPIIEKTKITLEPASIPQKTNPTSNQNKEFVFPLEKPTIPEVTLHDMHTLTKKIAPNLFLHEKTPSDRKAKAIKNAYQKQATHASATFLYFGNTYKSFIKNVVHATDIALCDASLIEKPFQNSDEWEAFLQSSHIKLIIATDTIFFDDKTLRNFYSENTAEKRCFLGNIPLLLLPDLSLYYKDPYLKRSLWNLICQSLPQTSPKKELLLPSLK